MLNFDFNFGEEGRKRANGLFVGHGWPRLSSIRPSRFRRVRSRWAVSSVPLFSPPFLFLNGLFADLVLFAVTGHDHTV